MSTAASLRRTPRRAAWALALALLLAQTLALLHGPLHGLETSRGPIVGTVGARNSAPQLAPLHAHEGEGAGLHALFGHHSADADCRLLDQLAQGLAPLPLVPSADSHPPSVAPQSLALAPALAQTRALRPPVRAPPVRA